MNAICKYCNKIISASDMAKTDAEKELTGGGARYTGHIKTPPNAGALFAHEECCREENK
jgi:hypothetical protein